MFTWSRRFLCVSTTLEGEVPVFQTPAARERSTPIGLACRKRGPEICGEGGTGKGCERRPKPSRKAYRVVSGVCYIREKNTPKYEYTYLCLVLIVLIIVKIRTAGEDRTILGDTIIDTFSR